MAKYKEVLKLKEGRYYMKAKKSIEEYSDEHDVLLNMYRCSKRYLLERDVTEVQKEIDKKILNDIKKLYIQYDNRLQNECLRDNGKSFKEYDLNITEYIEKGK